MKTLKMKIAIPELEGGRCVSAKVKDDYILTEFEFEEETKEKEEYITSYVSKSEFEEEKKEYATSYISESKLECRIYPNFFRGAWLEHKPTTVRQKELLTLYQDARAKGRLHDFTCMTIDPFFIRDEKSIFKWEGKLIYYKGLPIKPTFTQSQWSLILKKYNRSRNSRQMTRTEYVCRNLFLIQRLVESGYKIDEAWKAVCDDSRNIGNYHNSDKPNYDYDPTGSREVCGFYDLGNIYKLLAEDPWEDGGGFWIAGGFRDGQKSPVASLYHESDVEYNFNAVGMLAFD